MVNVMRYLLNSNIILQRNLNGRSCSRIAIRLNSGSEKIRANSHRVNNLEKRFLVWTGKFKTLDEVPTLVPADVMEKARNKMRIRVSNIMIVATLIGCLVMVVIGKKKRDSGDSLQKRNLDWHKSYMEEENKKQNAN